MTSTTNKAINKPLSIAICSYNRADQLAITLESFLAHSGQLHHFLLPEDEIIVVDNNSKDHTRETVERFADRLPLHYVFESNQGLSAARNKALSEFRNDALIFIDDDITIEPNFLHAYRDALSSHGDQVFLGGRIVVDWQGRRPTWYRTRELALLNGLVGDYNLGEAPLQYTANMLLPYGANFLLSRDLIEAVGDFDETLGLNGENIERGEESDYFSRALKHGFQGYYIPTAQVAHRFQTERLNIKYLFRYGLAKGRMADLEFPVSYSKTLLKIIKLLPQSTYQLFKGRLDNFYQCVINLGIQFSLLKKSTVVRK